MPVNLTSTDVSAAWNANAHMRAGQWKRRRYFKGEHIPSSLAGTRLDGREKTRLNTNWTARAARYHTGFLTSHPVTYVSNNSPQDPSLSAYEAFYLEQGLAGADTEHMRNALLYGYSPEVVTGAGSTNIVTTYWPWDFTFIHDETGQVAAAIQRIVIEPNTINNGTFMAKASVLFRLYDDQKILTYESKSNAAASLNTGHRDSGHPYETTAENLMLIDQEEHYFGAVPVVAYEVTEDADFFLSDAFFRQVDAWDTTRSSLSDDIKHNVDSLLKLSNFNYQSVLQKDSKGRMVLEKMKEIGILPVPEGGDASYISRNVDIEKFKYDLAVTRLCIHIMAAIPDLEEATLGSMSGGSTITNISGVALKLLFHDMVQTSYDFEKNLTKGLRRRVKLWNSHAVKLGRSVVEDYTIKFTRNLPFNDTELLQYLTNMKEVLAVEDILRLLPWVENPASAAANFRAEAQGRNDQQ